MRRPFLLVLPAFALLAACQPERGGLAEAQRHYADGRWGDARIELMNFLKTHPDNVAALKLMARIQLAGGSRSAPVSRGAA